MVSSPTACRIAKALSSAYLPISAVLLSPEMTEIIDAESRKHRHAGAWLHLWRPSGAAAVALKTIEIYQTRDVVGHVRHVEPVFLKRLAALADHPLVGEAKGVGLIAGIELVADKAKQAGFRSGQGRGAQAGRSSPKQEGLIVRPLPGDRFALCPPLVISEAEIDELFDRLERALAKTLDWANSEKL